MKKVVMIVVCVTACSFLFAQHSNVQFGLKGGVNVASLNVETGGDFNSRASFYAGGLAHIHVSSHFAIQPEVYYSGQGGKKPQQVVKLGYLNIPVLLQYMAGNGFRLQTGPQLGILLSPKQDLAGVEQDLDANFKTADFSWAFGASYQFPGCGFGVDARYNLGINNVNEGTNDVQNRVLALGIFYQFMASAHKH